MAKQDLVSYLQREIAEQKRVDAAMSGAPRISEDSQVPKESTTTAPKIHMILPADAKKRKQTKQLYTDRGIHIHMILGFMVLIPSAQPTISVPQSTILLRSHTSRP